MKIRVGTGFSKTDNAFSAGRKAAQQALSNFAGQPASLIIVFTTPSYDLPQLLNGIRSITGNTQLVGATGCGQITHGEFSWLGKGVSVLALSAGPYRYGLASSRNVKGNLENAGKVIARASKAQAGPSPYAAIILFVDCLAGDLQQLLQGVYRITGPNVAITGGAASDEMKFERTFVFHNDEIIMGGAVALWIASERPLQVVTRHGWKPLGIPVLVTGSEDTEILEFGGRPAALVYEEQLGFAPGELSADAFWSTSIMHPLGLLQPDGTSVIRVARAKTERGSLIIHGCVPPVGSAVQVMGSSVDELLDVPEEVAATALAAHDEGGVLLIFSCAARAVILGLRAPEEARRLQTVAGDIPTFGFYCCGEFARTAGVLGTHNATFTALAL